MHRLSEFVDLLGSLLERGGPVMTAILVLSIVLWVLILERYRYLYFTYPGKRQQLIEQWQQRQDRSSWHARRIREGLISEIASSLRQFLLPISALTIVLPLLGLLGTVTGMIKTFEVMMVFGMDNARGMASGVSEALLTTAAGLVTSLAGLYFSSNLEHRAKLETQKASDLLIYH
ncbi:MAG: MotA/TolQ/ExbB proton channel family protein [Gammaproteobacteria bacterium]|nr:MotA/TolQ/ExbB proton channel family protein [Gammaproteobacteria bacterium]